MYIEPCCCDTQLPELLKKNKDGFCFFQTSGDVVFTKLLSAVSHLADKGRLYLVIPDVDAPLLNTINHYFTREWITGFSLLTQKNRDDLVRGILESHLAKVEYAHDPMIIDGLFAIVPEEEEGRSLVVQGAMLLEQDFSMSLYAAAYAKGCGVSLQALESSLPKWHIKPVTL